MTVDVGVAHRGGRVGKTSSITAASLPVLVGQKIDRLFATRQIALDALENVVHFDPELLVITGSSRGRVARSSDALVYWTIVKLKGWVEVDRPAVAADPAGALVGREGERARVDRPGAAGVVVAATLAGALAVDLVAGYLSGEAKRHAGWFVERE